MIRRNCCHARFVVATQNPTRFRGYVYLKYGQPRHGNRVTVYCRECQADIGICVEDVPEVTLEMVTEMWNRRAHLAAGQAAGEGKCPWCDLPEFQGKSCGKNSCLRADRRARVAGEINAAPQEGLRAPEAGETEITGQMTGYALGTSPVGAAPERRQGERRTAGLPWGDVTERRGSISDFVTRKPFDRRRARAIAEGEG